MTGIVSKYMEFVSDILPWESGGWTHQPHKTVYHKLSALGCFTRIFLKTHTCVHLKEVAAPHKDPNNRGLPTCCTSR